MADKKAAKNESTWTCYWY